MLDQLRERLAVDQLHGVVMDAPIRADGVDRHDIGMVQLGGGLRFVLESLQVLGIERGGERQDLDGDAPPQRKLQRLVDDAHPAPADFAHQAKIAQGLRAADRFGVRGGGLADRRGRGFGLAQIDGGGLNQIEPFQALGQLGGDLVMPGQKLAAIQRPARFERGQIFLGCGDDPGIVDAHALVLARPASWLLADR